MRTSNARALRLAGLFALLGGLCYVVVGIFHPANQLSSVSTTRWETVHIFACAMSFFGVVGLAGIYARQAVRSGWFGLVGYVLLSLWLVLIMGFSFVEAFILPHLVNVTPEFVRGWLAQFNGTTSQMDMGFLPTLWTLTGPIYILGGLLFGIGTFRAHILPRGAAVLLAAGTVLAPVAGLLPLTAQPKIAIPTGLALAWLGYALITEKRPASAEPESNPIETVVA